MSDLNFSDLFNSTPAAESGGFKTIPEGTYTAVIDHATLDFTKTPARLSVTYTLMGEFKGQKLFGNYTLEGRGLGFLKKDLKSIGADYSTVKKPEDLCQLFNDFSGRSVEVFVRPREYNGKIYSSVYLNGLAESTPDQFGF